MYDIVFISSKLITYCEATTAITIIYRGLADSNLDYLDREPVSLVLPSGADESFMLTEMCVRQVEGECRIKNDNP